MARAGPDDWWHESKSNLEGAAQILKNSGKSSEAYFHAGQSIEFILKAILIKRENYQFLPDGYRAAKWHDLKLCFDAARLKADLNQPQTSRRLHANWLTARDWKSNARFPDLKAPQRELDDIFVAICNDADGVWSWLDTIYRKL